MNIIKDVVQNIGTLLTIRTVFIDEPTIKIIKVRKLCIKK